MKSVAATLFLVLSFFPAFADTIKPGHVMGNATSAERKPTDVPAISVIQQAGSGAGAGVGAALGNGVNTANGLAALNSGGFLSTSIGGFGAAFAPGTGVTAALGSNANSNLGFPTLYTPTINVGNTCGYDATVASGTYNSTTGAVSITLNASATGLSVGQTLLMSNLTGTGAFASLNGYFVSTSGTGGTTVNYTAATGLGASTVTGGFVLVPTGATCTGGSASAGMITGNISVGGNTPAVNAFVVINQDRLYVNPNQEMRGVNSTTRHYFDATTSDEVGLGWDSIPLVGTSVIDARNVQDIHGNVKSVVAQTYFEGTTGHNYAVNQSYGFQASLYDLAPQATVAHWYGSIVNGTPQGISGGVVTQEIGDYIQSLSGTTVWGGFVGPMAGTSSAIGYEISAITAPSGAAIKIDGSGTTNSIQFPTTQIYEDSGAHLVLNLHSNYLNFQSPLTATTATFGAASALPATPQGYMKWCVEGGSCYVFPFYNP